MESEVPRVISNNISNSLNQLQFVSIFDIIIEDITWPREDTKFLFKCSKTFHE